MNDVDDLIEYLDTGLTMATLHEMDRNDLHRLRDGLHHWAQMVDRIYRERLAMPLEEENE